MEGLRVMLGRSHGLVQLITQCLDYSQCKTHCLRGPGQTAADQLQHPGHLPLHDTSPAREGSRAVRDEA